MSDVVQKFSGDKSNLEQALKDLTRDYVRLENQVQKLSDTSKKAHQEQRGGQGAANSLLKDGVRELTGMVTGYLSLQGAVAAYNRELEAQIRLQDEALAAHQKLAAGQAEIALNTFGQSPQTRQRLRAEAQRISSLTGVPEADVTRSIGRLAGKGVGLDLDQIVGAQEMAARLGRHTQEQIEPLSTGILQTMRIGRLEIEESAALIQSGSAAAFVSEPHQTSRFLQQGVSGMAANIPGGGPQAVEQSLELLAYISQAVGEERGEAGRTSGIALAAQLNEFRQGRGKWAGSLPGGRKIDRPEKGMPTLPIDAIRYLQTNPRAAKRFLDRATFEQLFEGEWRNLILGEEQAKGLLAETQRVVGPDVPALRALLRELESGTPQMALSTLHAQGQATIDQFKGRLGRGDVASSMRVGRDQAAAAAAPYRRLEWIQRGLSSLLNDAIGWGTNRSPEFHLEEMKMMQREMTQRDLPFPAPRGLTRPRLLPMGAEERRVYDLLEKLIKNGEDQLAELKKKRPDAGPAAQREVGRQRER
jgi:hypothetical protein